MKNKIAQVVLGLPVEGPFDYSVGEDIKDKIAVGKRVRVSFGNSVKIGYVTGLINKSRYKNLKPILSLLDDFPVTDSKMLDLTREFASHYACSTGEAIETALPALLRQGKPSGIEIPPEPIEENPKAVLRELILLHDPDGERRWPFLIERI